MKRTIWIATLLITLLTVNVNAQERKYDPQKRADKELKMLKKLPDFTVEQEALVKKVHEDWIIKVKEFKEKYDNIEEAKKELKIINKEKNSKIKELLTDSQIKRVKKLKKKRRG